MWRRVEFKVQFASNWSLGFWSLDPCLKWPLVLTYSADLPCSNLAAQSCGGTLLDMRTDTLKVHVGICNGLLRLLVPQAVLLPVPQVVMCDSMVENNIGMVWINKGEHYSYVLQWVGNTSGKAHT